MLKRLLTTICVTLGLLQGGLPAWADTTYTLRALTVSVDFPCCDPDFGNTRLTDTFANGNPLMGTPYGSTAGISGNAQYAAINQGFGSDVEMNGPATDFYGTTYGIGGLQFRRSEAIAAPTNLDAPGTTSTINRLVLINPTASSLLNPGQSFEVNSYWNFSAPEAGTGYGQRLTDNTQAILTPGSPAFDNQVDLRVIRGNDGSPVVQLRRQTYDGNTLANQSFTLSVAGALDSGWTLADVALIEFNLHYNTGNPVLLASFNLSDALGNDIGGRTFSQQLGIFSGEAFSTFTVGTFYTEAVPEPATVWLLGGGAALLLVAQRRRSAIRREPR